MASGGADKTEKATPKRRGEARKKGQIARSADLNSIFTLAAMVAVLGALAPAIVRRLAQSLHDGLVLTAQPDLVQQKGLGGLERSFAGSVIGALWPIVVVAVIVAILATGLQTRLKLSTQILKPSFNKLSPAAGVKRLLGPQAAVEALKQIVKVLVVGGAVGMLVWSQLHSFAGLVGTPPAAIMPVVGGSVRKIAWITVLGLLPLALADFFWQRYRIDKSLRMTKQEVKEESRQTDMPPEARAAIRRRQREQARKRMMAAVPTADVVIANPTHFAVALRYDGTKPAPEVVAKGADLVAAEIRRIAQENGVPIVEDPPLARGIYAAVEIGQLIPEEFFVAVAEVIAAVMRRSGKLRRLGIA
ncbi:MAG: flagellar biosynthesis protein FlhB [Actinobacteria bacterium]|nr:flagellar biosynthesis protein FlhB [Actinomycetota bacterium]MBV8561987.1 flagellar biosynthesis protein FlhB [Actinomycetota bacterium]